MRIKEIELDNFKSFGKHTLVPLLDGFTTISGPNGSGKSNIVDSLLFALGLSSTRSMRAERLPDLLNNLSGKNEAKVTVRFVNDNNEGIEVSRRIRVKDSGYTSTYTLNGRNATLSEIHEELIRYNVSPTGYNVIMQGDVTGIVTMSATERRKIIDELAGVAEFDRRIGQANDELNAVGEKIEHQKIVLAEILIRLEQLKSDRDQALKYLDLKSQKEQVEKDLVFVKCQELETKAATELTEIQKLDEQEQKLLEKLDEAEKSLFALRAEMSQIDQEIREKGGNEQLLLRQELENTRGELTREENKLSNVNGVIGEKNKLLKSIQGQLKTIDKHLGDIEKTKKQHRADQEAVNLVLVEKQGAYSAVMAEIEVMRQEKDKSSDKVTNLHDDLQKLRDRKHEFEVRRTTLTTRREAVNREVVELREKATEHIAKSADVKRFVAGMESKLVDQQALVAGIDRTIMQMDGELEGTREEIESKRTALETVNRRLIEVETTREVAGESGYGRAVEAVLESGIQGVHGTVGQLGKVNDQYTRALETAIGQRLSNVVVEDDSVAQQCIEFLKTQQAGRATFIPLNKISAQPPGLLPGRPGVIDFAYNLIDFNPRFTKAFQYACGQTIVMDTMENARRLLNQARMVTLEGELFDKSGTMSGGVDSKSKMHFSHKGETDLAVLKQTSKSLKDQIKWLQDSLKELTGSLAEEREKQTKARGELVQKQSDLETKKKLSQDLDNEIETVKPKLRTAGDEVDVIDQEVALIDVELKELNKQLAALEEALDKVREKGAKSKIELLIHESEGLRSDVEAIERDFKEIQRQIDTAQTEERLEIANRIKLAEQLQELLKELHEVEVQKPQFEAAISTLKAAIAEMEKKVSELSAELETLREAKEKIHERVTKTEVERTKADQEILRIGEVRKERKIAHFEILRELESLQEEIQRLRAENPDYQPPSAATVEQLRHQVERLERRMRALEPVNMKALEEYNQTDERQKELNGNLETLGHEKDEISQRIAGYDDLKKKTFLTAFDAINLNFQDIFAELSNGHGRLELENPLDPFAGGLVIRAQPRDKKMQRIEALSGGEKSLTALSFVFAFQRFAPAPFYAFDEVDMMLDGSNAERLARMVKRQSETAQFVVVSLRRPMIENSDHAIGVSLRADGFSRVVGIREVQLPDDPQPEPQIEPVVA
ncbi:MAG TPA: chromosome segregation protein SMC [Planktothrix sp.]